MITGGSSGIGYAIAERFLQEGASKVILVGRQLEKLQDASRRLSESMLGQATYNGDGEIATRAPEDDREVEANPRVGFVVGDVSVANEWMSELEKEMANVDILINSAGISMPNLLSRTSTDNISQMLKINLEGSIYTCRAMLKACMRARLKRKNAPVNSKETSNGNSPPVSKCIINISSLLALKGVTGTVTYAASKAGLLGLTKTMAVEAGDVLKGNTPMIQDFSNDRVNALRALIPINRFGHPEEVADAAVFLATNEYANNCVLNLDGGLSAV
ncbi:hypothetical protein UA08_07222 [Talaromyces atroroseus]|uniref:3-oxoacyl-[acyl-carrier-protein] reductase FabG n=1 Tax=Talaromyces atroroseus TaxID=1441469 RepID=A0A225AR87_TALAT|nr:hypothetical protein UA08_07222 [Talaromyces atroroseus]OKL57456.1 hypothetical protein UA08_07222 [Talaromyces atroroseus]